MKQINKKFRVEDPHMRMLNFIYLDLELNMQKIDKLSADDIELLKALQAEKQDRQNSSPSPQKKKPNKYA